MFILILLAFISLFTMSLPTLAQQGPTQCHDPAMTSWMLNSEGENPCLVLQDVMRVCNPSFSVNWLTSSYSCDNESGSISAACCCGSPTFALMSACWSCQYNYTMDIVSTTFIGFEKDCASNPTPITSYDPIISSQVAKIDIPLWAKIEPPSGKWDLAGAWRNATPATTSTPPAPTTYPTPASNSGLSSGAIIGIIVGSVFGTALMFILAAVVLWRCLDLGRYRQQQQRDIRVGQDMGYLDGEYIYVQPANSSAAPEGGMGLSLARRLTSRRDTRGLRPREDIDLDASDNSTSRQMSQYDDDTSRPLRTYSRSPSYLAEPRELPYSEPPSPYSPARHASIDGKYRGYHPGSSPRASHRPSLEDRYEGSHRREDDYRSSRGDYPYRASWDRRREYDEPEYRPSHERSPNRFSQHRPSGDRFSTRASADRFRPSRDRPISGQFSNRRPISGQFSYHRTSTERKRDHRVSVRSGLRPASFDSVRRSVDRDGGGRFTRIEDPRPSREGTRFSREEVRFSRDGGRGGRYSRENARYRKASLSEGEEDLARDSEDESPRSTSLDFGRRREHLRKRSQSARTSCDPGHDVGPSTRAGPTRVNDSPIPSASSSTPTTNKDSSSPPTPAPAPAPLKRPREPRPPLRVTNASPDMDPYLTGGASYLNTPSAVVREPGILARARNLMHVGTPKSSRSVASSHNQASTSQAPVPPSAWQRLRHIPSALSGQARSSIGSESDATSAYHTAQGHTPLGTGTSGAGTPVTEFGNRTRLNGSMETEGAGSYHQETDAGVQLVVEESRAATPEEGHPEPPAYAIHRPSDEHRPTDYRAQSGPYLQTQYDSDVPASASNTHLLQPDNRLSVLTRETDLESTVSSGVIQTWTSARRPTGFVGTGRVVREDIPYASVDEHGAMSDMRTSAEDVLRTSQDSHSLDMLGASSTAVSTAEHAETSKSAAAAFDVLTNEGSGETEILNSHK